MSVTGSHHGVLGKMVLCELLMKKQSYVNTVAYGPHHPITYNAYVFEHKTFTEYLSS